VSARGRAPYRYVLTHGFTVDGEGKKMSKSQGNTIAPEEVINKYGADILRLWAISSDYSVDIRISDEILGQLVDSYRKIRNTIRFILGNLNGFNPKSDTVKKEELEKIDKWLLHRLQIVTKDILQSYESWQFHIIVKDIVNFCNNDLSSFYLDIVKDRLYCSGPTKKRASSQTALYYTLLNLLALTAPILSFTSEEGYTLLAREVHAPNGIDFEESIHLSYFPKPERSFIDNKLAKTWETLIEVRKDVLKQIEILRTEKNIGHSLECDVILLAEGKTYDLLQKNTEELAPLFVVSHVTLKQKSESFGSQGEIVQGKLVDLIVKKSTDKKCPRCWRYLKSVGKDRVYPELCERCASVISKSYS
jgi:isoleucyl-tRNA synthetase